MTTCTNISTGWEGDLLSLRLDYKEAGEYRTEEVVLKLYHGQNSGRKAKKEFRNLQQLAQIGYPVPHTLFLALEDSPFGRAAVAMEKIQGQTAADLFDQSTQEQQQALVAQCCQLYIDLHALDWTVFVSNPARYQTTNTLHVWLEQMRYACNQQLPRVFDPVIEWLEKRYQEVPCQRLSVLHGDFHLNNLIMRDDGTLFVIDWTGTGVSDYRFDLAWTLLLQRSQGATKLANMVLEEYERLAGHRIEQFAFFEVIACLKRLFDIAVSLHNGAATLGMKPTAEEEMKQQVNRIEAVYAQLQEWVARPLPEIEQLILTMRKEPTFSPRHFLTGDKRSGK
ncbi:MAG: phosphotransferase [Ktedonobacteraceae bacterium]